MRVAALSLGERMSRSGALISRIATGDWSLARRSPQTRAQACKPEVSRATHFAERKHG
jgi:hypothetical protein